MNMTEYAKHRGITKGMLSAYLKNGKLDGTFKRVGRGYNFDVKAADAALAGNLSPTMSKKAQAKAPPSMSLNDAKTQKEIALAELRELELGQKKGELIPASDVETMLTKLISSAKTRILGIKSKVAPLLSEAITDVETRDQILTAIDRETRGALTELSNNAIK